jgi:hypothetical protein
LEIKPNVARSIGNSSLDRNHRICYGLPGFLTRFRDWENAMKRPVAFLLLPFLLVAIVLSFLCGHIVGQQSASQVPLTDVYSGPVVAATEASKNTANSSEDAFAKTPEVRLSDKPEALSPNAKDSDWDRLEEAVTELEWDSVRGFFEWREYIHCRFEWLYDRITLGSGVLGTLEEDQ